MRAWSELILLSLVLELTFGAEAAWAGKYQAHVSQRRSASPQHGKKQSSSNPRGNRGSSSSRHPDHWSDYGHVIRPIEEYGAGENGKQIYIPAYCANLIEEMAGLLEEGSPTRGQRAGHDRTMNPYQIVTGLDVPDLTLLDPVLVREAQRTLMRLWGIMYGRNYEMASPPSPSDPIGELKILLTVAGYQMPGHVRFAIPVDLIRYGEAEARERELYNRQLEEEVNLLADRWEFKQKTVYQPEPVIKVSNAIGRMHSHPSEAGARGILTPMLSIITESLDDYLSIVNYAAEVDRMQVKVLLFLAQLALSNQLPVRGHRETFLLLEGLSAATMKPAIEGLPDSVSLHLEALLQDGLGEGSTRVTLNEKQKKSLETLLHEMWDYEELLIAARQRFGNNYPAGIMSFYLVSKMARPNGFKAIEMQNLLRDSWIDNLNARHMVLAWTATKLLNRQGIRNTATDSWLDLSILAPRDIIKKYVNDSRLHELIANKILGRQAFNYEYNNHSRVHARLFEKQSLQLRTGAAVESRFEGGLREVTLSEARRFMSNAEGTPVPLLNSLLKTLEKRDGEETAKQASQRTRTGRAIVRVVPKVRELPPQLPHFLAEVGLSKRPTVPPQEAATVGHSENPPREAVVFGSFHQAMDFLNEMAKDLYDRDIAFQALFTTAQDPKPRLDDSDAGDEVKKLEAHAETILREVLKVQHALEHALVLEAKTRLASASEEEKKGYDFSVGVLQARADASATLAHEMVSQYSALARLVIHDTALSPLTSLQRRTVIETIRQILAHPEEVEAEFSEHGGRFGERVGNVARDRARTRWKIALWTTVLLGITGAGYGGYSTYRALFPPKPGVTVPKPNETETPPVADPPPN